MRYLVLTLACAITLMVNIQSVRAASGQISVPMIQCTTGPVTKTFNDTSWLVYSCSDKKSLVLLAAPGNPAAPFYFAFDAEDDGYRLSGGGQGAKGVTAQVFEQFKAFSPQQIEALAAETRRSQ